MNVMYLAASDPSGSKWTAIIALVMSSAAYYVAFLASGRRQVDSMTTTIIAICSTLLIFSTGMATMYALKVLLADQDAGAAYWSGAGVASLLGLIAIMSRVNKSHVSDVLERQKIEMGELELEQKAEELRQKRIERLEGEMTALNQLRDKAIAQGDDRSEIEYREHLTRLMDEYERTRVEVERERRRRFR